MERRRSSLNTEEVKLIKLDIIWFWRGKEFQGQCQSLGKEQRRRNIFRGKNKKLIWDMWRTTWLRVILMGNIESYLEAWYKEV